MNRKPALSVVMSVYNGAQYLSESIGSILRQSFTDFEFIIINDGSTDHTEKIIDKYSRQDERIIALSQRNTGLTKSLNRGIAAAGGKYIARQDADDVSFKHRFEQQIRFLQAHRDVVLCGTWFQEINEGKGSRLRKYPVDDRDLRKNIRYVNHFCHPSVVFSKDAFIKAGGYDESFLTGQDFELWIRMAKQGRIANIPQVLVKRRIGFDTNISWEKRSKKVQVVNRVLAKHFDGLADINVFKFTRYCLPKLVYGYLPVPLLKVIRRVRYT